MDSRTVRAQQHSECHRGPLRVLLGTVKALLVFQSATDFTQYFGRHLVWDCRPIGYFLGHFEGVIGSGEWRERGFCIQTMSGNGWTDR